jgi:putative heme-binding domain-containing protein
MMDLRIVSKPDEMKLFSVRPQHDTFGLDNAMLIFPGDPDRSVLFQRISRRGRGQMPPLVSTVVDDKAVALFRGWIRGMKPPQQNVREWRMEDFVPLLEQVKRERSFESGKSAFRETGCVQCHRFAGEGGSVGPDLSGVGRRLAARELLESILLPSKVIAEGYALTVIETKPNESVTGRVLREDDQAVVMRPPGAEESVTIRKADIRRRTVSAVSNMPTGTLSALSEKQILDLLALLISDGDAKHPAFQPGAAITPPPK